jgi:hypothetical protein
LFGVGWDVELFVFIVALGVDVGEEEDKKQAVAGEVVAQRLQVWRATAVSCPLEEIVY